MQFETFKMTFKVALPDFRQYELTAEIVLKIELRCKERKIWL